MTDDDSFRTYSTFSPAKSKTRVIFILPSSVDCLLLSSFSSSSLGFSIVSLDSDLLSKLSKIELMMLKRKKICISIKHPCILLKLL